MEATNLPLISQVGIKPEDEETKNEPKDNQKPTFSQKPEIFQESMPNFNAPITENQKKQKIDFEKRYLDHIKKLSDKKLKEQQEIENERKKMIESREKLKKVVLARAEKLRQLKEVNANISNGTSGEEVKSVEPDDKRKLIEKGKLRKFFRSRYASLLSTIQENQKIKKEEGEQREKRKKEMDKKMKAIVGVDQIQSKVMKDISKLEPIPEILPSNNENTPMEKASNNNNKPKERDSYNKSASMFQRQQQYLQQISEKKQMEKKKQEEASKKKEKVLKKLIEEAKQQIEKVPKAEKKEIKQEQPTVKSKYVSKQEMDQITEGFLARNQATKKISNLNITDFSSWKRRHELDESTKVFIIMGGYPDIKRALKKRGWVENKQKSSSFFDLKWTLRAKDVEMPLEDYQIVNHFDKNTLLTTKVGLCHNLRNLIWFNNVDIDTFYPRSFDLIDAGEIADFTEDFKSVKAECILKDFYISGFKIQAVGEEKLLVALNICERRLRDLDELLDESNPELSQVTPEEWEIIGTDELTPEMLAKKKHEAWFKRMMRKFDPNKKRKASKKKKEKVEEKKTNTDEQNKASDAEPETEEDKALKQRVMHTLEELRKRFPQFDINGNHNIWIVKPAGMSRGRGIRIFNNLAEIIDYAQCREQQYVAQKYIENPMIILNRKFDIRQWVLVKCWNPLTVWFYEECYIRFGAVEYNIQEITNRYMHLTNNSVTKHCEGADNEIEGNMWEQSDLEEFIKVLFMLLINIL